MYRPDTSIEVQKIYDKKIKALSSNERFLRGLSLTHFCREMCWAGIRNRYPQMNPQEAKLKFFETVYGSSFSEDEKSRIIPFLVNTQ